MRPSGHSGPCRGGIRAPQASQQQALHPLSVVIKQSGKLEPHPPTHTPGPDVPPTALQAAEQGRRGARWEVGRLERAHQSGQSALLAVDQTGIFAGYLPRLQSQQVRLQSWLPGHHLGGAPGKASGGSIEPLRTGPYLSREPGWYSTNKSKPGAGRQKSGGESRPRAMTPAGSIFLKTPAEGSWDPSSNP